MNCKHCGNELVAFGKAFLVHKYHPKDCKVKIIRKEEYFDLDDELITENTDDRVE